MCTSNRDKSSYVAIDQCGIVVSSYPSDSDLLSWMADFTNHRFWIMDSDQAVKAIGKPLQDYS